MRPGVIGAGCAVFFLCVAGAVFGQSEGIRVEPSYSPANGERPWQMHTIDDVLRNADSLGMEDINGDGLIDLAVAWEKSNRITIHLNPGPERARERWPRTVIGFGGNVEEAVFADMDGDGRFDIVSTQGQEFDDWGNEPGVKIFWGPPIADLESSQAWSDELQEVIPETWQRGQFIFGTTYQLDGRGGLDVVATGRILRNGRHAGLIWVEAPEDPSGRDLSLYRVHDIDPGVYGSSWVEFDDVDDDGDPDIILTDSDIQNPPGTRLVAWYEHPGFGTDAIREPWTRHVIYRGDDLGNKAYVEVADMDGDGANDVLVQSSDTLYIFRKSATAPVAFETIAIPKTPETSFVTRGTLAGDVNGDGRMDVVGFLSHDNQGEIPADRWSIYWMEPETDDLAGPWRTHIIKWSFGKIPPENFAGEKWERSALWDVDQDGDLDLIATEEEIWTNTRPWFDPEAGHAQVGLVWFENPTIDAASGIRSGAVASSTLALLIALGFGVVTGLVALWVWALRRRPKISSSRAAVAAALLDTLYRSTTVGPFRAVLGPLARQMVHLAGWAGYLHAQGPGGDTGALEAWMFGVVAEAEALVAAADGRSLARLRVLSSRVATVATGLARNSVNIEVPPADETAAQAP